MDELRELIKRIEQHGDRRVSGAGWEWAARLRNAAEAVASTEVLELADAVEAAVAADGCDGLVDLALAGPALGGLHSNDVAQIVAVIDERAARAVAA